ncbi:hypothetical protein PR048_026298 [Dryococelus australis]|uniref:Uncharacterized protein n=1 Tax=Dryococelus australis TaxID=614101 RepID=A0ABQ9GKX0_9NEOP|nr:hypothetical protein PR048_026298 [Dryococelus australis]
MAVHSPARSGDSALEGHASVTLIAPTLLRQNKAKIDTVENRRDNRDDTRTAHVKGYRLYARRCQLACRDLVLPLARAMGRATTPRGSGGQGGRVVYVSRGQLKSQSRARAAVGDRERCRRGAVRCVEPQIQRTDSLRRALSVRWIEHAFPSERIVWSSAGTQGRGKREIPEKICRPMTSSGTIPICEKPVTRSGIEPGWWEASGLTARPPRPLNAGMKGRGKRDILEKTRLPNGIVRHDSHLRKSGVNRSGIEPGSLRWEASSLTAQPPWSPDATPARFKTRATANHNLRSERPSKTEHKINMSGKTWQKLLRSEAFTQITALVVMKKECTSREKREITKPTDHQHLHPGTGPVTLQQVTAHDIITRIFPNRLLAQRWDPFRKTSDLGRDHTGSGMDGPFSGTSVAPLTTRPRRPLEKQDYKEISVFMPRTLILHNLRRPTGIIFTLNCLGGVVCRDLLDSGRSGRRSRDHGPVVLSAGVSLVPPEQDGHEPPSSQPYILPRLASRPSSAGRVFSKQRACVGSFDSGLNLNPSRPLAPYLNTIQHQ